MQSGSTPPAKPNKPFAAAIRPNRGAAHILVVDDEPLIAQSISDLLTLSNQYRVTLAAGGRDALTKIEASVASASDSFDLVLLDIDMPMVSGLDVLQWIRKHPRLHSMRVVMLTGIADKRDMVNALNEGADDYITKPYHPQELLARIQTTLRTQQLEKQLARQSSQLAMLNTITNTITKRLELKELLQASVDGVRELLDVEVTAVFMQDGKRNRLRCQHLKADKHVEITPNSFTLIPIGQGVISKAFTQRTTHCVNEAITDTRFDPTVDSPSGYRVENVISAAIYMRGHPIGVLVAMNKRHGTFEESDADLFVSLAGTMSQALENTYLFSSVRTRQQELLDNRNALQAIIDGIRHPIYTINKRYEVVSINATKGEELAQFSAESGESSVGKVCYETFFNRTSPCAHCRVPELLETSVQVRWSIRQTREDYFPTDWDIDAYPMPGKKENSPVAVIVWQDRTEERRLENSLHQAAKLSAVGQLAAGVAHEINNPLTVIKTGAEMLKDVVTPEAGEDYELVEWINNATDRATKVVRGLLDFARQSSYDFQRGSVESSIESTIELVSYQMRKGSIEIVREYGEDLPEAMASWEHLKTVWLNLLLNARDALETRDTNRQVRIITRLAPDAEHVHVLFNDNGEGMEEHQLAHIFVPFFTTKDPGKGTGLGLATSHRIIDRHGAEISVTSELGVGTTFLISLPISETAHLSAEKEESIPTIPI